MKKLSYLIFCLVMSLHSRSQVNAGKNIAREFADRIKDSIHLTPQQTDLVYKVNVTINDQKQNVWRQISDFDSLQHKIQNIESTRDSLYQKILRPSQYLRYKEKKSKLISVKQN